MSKIIIGLILVAILTIGGGLYFSRSQDSANNPSILVQDNIDPTPSSVPLGASGSSFMDPKGVFTILYPADYEIDASDPEHPRIFKRGETQRPQTELYDGALIVFESVDLGSKTLSTWINERITDATNNGMQEVIKAKFAVSFNKYSGFSYTLRGLGETTYTAIQKDTNSKNAVIISTLVADPENKGYQGEVNSALNSITLLK